MSGKTDLKEILQNINPYLLDESFVFITSCEPIEDLLNLLNKEICETAARGMFVTMLVGIYDSNKKELLLSNAGHEPPLVIDKEQKFSNFSGKNDDGIKD